MDYEYDYDIIIIGAGLAGLYAAYNIKNKYPDKTFVILESNKRDYIGGRIGNETFYGQEIVVGAGVGRKDTDKLLIALLHDLDIKTQEFTVNMHYSKELPHIVDVKQCFRLLHLFSFQTYKSVCHFKNGRKCHTRRKPLKKTEIEMIKLGKFIPNLFSNLGK